MDDFDWYTTHKFDSDRYYQIEIKMLREKVKAQAERIEELEELLKQKPTHPKD
jgi:hypothetical protein